MRAKSRTYSAQWTLSATNSRISCIAESRYSGTTLGHAQSNRATLEKGQRKRLQAVRCGPLLVRKRPGKVPVVTYTYARRSKPCASHACVPYRFATKNCSTSHRGSRRCGHFQRHCHKVRRTEKEETQFLQAFERSKLADACLLYDDCMSTISSTCGLRLYYGNAAASMASSWKSLHHATESIQYGPS